MLTTPLLYLLLSPLPSTPLKPTFRVHIQPESSAQTLPPPTTVTFALPGSAADDLLRQAPAPAKLQAVYNVMKSQLSTWNIDPPNTQAPSGEKYNKITTSFASGFPLDVVALNIASSNAVDRDGWMATEPPGPFLP